MCPPSNSVEPVTERITTRRLAEQHHEHHNFGVPRTSECFRNPLRRTLLRGPGLEYAPTQPHAGPPTDPMPESELFMLTSATSQDDDPLAFLSHDIPCRAYVTGASPTKKFNRFEPIHTTGIGNGNGNGNGSWRNSPLADLDVGFGCGVDRSVPSGLGVGGDEKKGLLDPGTGALGMYGLHGRPQEIPDGQLDASPWVSSRPHVRYQACPGCSVLPHIYKFKDRDAGVSLASLSTPLAAASLVPAEDHIPETARGTMTALNRAA
jgi:hypothetical protein